MAVEILMPELGESVHEGTVSRWLKKEGEFVKED
jgi:pyruvate/2-oxoglutarate dehydrogenase complex dihydrolipoamide acyltransferase (E2) component